MSTEKVIYSMAGVSKIYPPNKQVLKGIYLSYFYGAKIGVIGLNGSGKSTLLKIMAGVDKDFLGEAKLTPGYTVGYLEQEPVLDPNKTVKEVVEEGAKHVYELIHKYEAISARFAEELTPQEMEDLINEQAALQDQIDAIDGWSIDAKLARAMEALSCPPPDTPIRVLSGGEKRRVALCRLLIQQPDILLLDEPTNHLDAESVAWLERHLQEYKGTVIAVTHDRYFLDNVAEWILELDRGQGIPWKGNYSSWLEQKKKRLEQEEKAETKRIKTLQRELEWIHMTPKARQAKGKARLNAYEKLLQQDAQERERELEIFIPSGPRLGDVVINFENVTKRFGDKVLFENLSFNIPKAAIVGIIGPNGAGKTTLFRLITGELQPDSGKITIGSTVVLGYADQEHRDLNPEDDVFKAITGGNEVIILGNREVNARAYVARFNFSGTEQNKKVKDLSGGEKNRLHLAKILKSGANVLLLDEPTNDIDVNTLRALEEGIENFGGCALIISHDRWFLDRIATHIIAFEANEVIFYEGNFTEYVEFLQKHRGKDITKKAKYKSLT
ncbi:MAG: energy-dependent translational throttle protein EttA [Bacteroidia bacterium]|nr:energy-dependent translational throttle protein EttA [Bacteroidia bacterium]MDW8159436.1 energy-dependent translational throttle protein EttA [Bacteroidia bacterium]